jgi:hypothetical protein
MVTETKIISVKSNPYGYKYNVQVWVDGYYTGSGRFFKTKSQAVKYAKAYMRKN